MDFNALSKVGYGLYVASTKVGDKLNGCIVNTVFQISNEPIMFAVCIAKENYTHQMVMESRFITVSTLTQECPMDFIGIFGFNSGRDINKFDNVRYNTDVFGGPILQEYTCSSYSFKVVNTVDVYKHTVFICEAVDMQMVSKAIPMTYAYYKDVVKGGAPAAAPTAILADDDGVKEGTYTCKVCKYVYDPQKGDAKGGIEAGTSFEELPHDWVCPICRKGKEFFVKNS